MNHHSESFQFSTESQTLSFHTGSRVVLCTLSSINVTVCWINICMQQSNRAKSRSIRLQIMFLVFRVLENIQI